MNITYSSANQGEIKWGEITFLALGFPPSFHFTLQKYPNI